MFDNTYMTETQKRLLKIAVIGAFCGSVLLLIGSIVYGFEVTFVASEAHRTWYGSLNEKNNLVKTLFAASSMLFFKEHMATFISLTAIVFLLIDHFFKKRMIKS